jgi:hypothetical protein
MRTEFFVFGVVVELVGVGLLALDVIAPPAKKQLDRAAARAVALRRTLESTTRRILRRPRNVTIHPGAATVSLEAPGTTSGIVTPGEHTPVDLLARWLREHAIETNTRLAHLEHQTTADRDQHRRDLTDLREALSSDIRAAVESSERAYLGWRLTGFALAGAGITISLIASLMPAS